jgi:hypothetical protein
VLFALSLPLVVLFLPELSFDARELLLPELSFGAGSYQLFAVVLCVLLSVDFAGRWHGC